MNGPAWTLTSAAAALRAGDVISVALTEACLAVCRAQDATLGAAATYQDRTDRHGRVPPWPPVGSTAP